MTNFAFFGTDEFAVGVLNTLKNKDFLPSLIVTVPDKPQGRKMIMTPPLTKIWAEENKIKCIQPASLKLTHSEISNLFSIQDKPASSVWDLFVVASYGKIIPQSILDLPKHGALNVHPSLLPKYRGPTPIEYTILSGDTETAVSIILLDAEMDHGPIVAVEKINLTGEEYFLDLIKQTAEVGGNLLANIIPELIAGKITPIEQDHARATFTKKIKKEEGLIDITGDPILNYRKIRALTPRPGTYFFVDKPNGSTSKKKIRVVIKKARLENDQLVIERVIPEGKKEMLWKDFARNL